MESSEQKYPHAHIINNNTQTEQQHNTMRATIFLLAIITIASSLVLPIRPAIIGDYVWTGTPIAEPQCPSYCGAPTSPECVWNPHTYQICSLQYNNTQTEDFAVKKRQTGYLCPGACGPVCAYDKYSDWSYCGCVKC